MRPGRTGGEPGGRRGVGSLVLTAAAMGGCGELGVGWLLLILAPATSPDGPTVPALLSGELVAARAILDTSGVAAVGLTLLPLLLRGVRPRVSSPALAAAYRASVVAGATWAVAAAVLCWLQVSVATGTSPFDVTTAQAGDYLTAAVAGRALVVAGMCGLVVASAGWLALRRATRIPEGLPLVAAVLGLLALPVTPVTPPQHRDTDWR